MPLETFKICHFTDCDHCPIQQSVYVNPCRAFRTEEGSWYNELTSASLTNVVLSDGTHVNVGQQLEYYYNQVVHSWEPGKPVKLQLLRNKPKHRPAKSYSPPTTNAREQDIRASGYVQAQWERDDIIKHIRELKDRIRSYNRLSKRFGVDTANEVQAINEEIDELRERQADIDTEFADIADYAKQETEWENRWVNGRGRLTNVVYIHRKGDHLFEINRDGLKLDGMFVVVGYSPTLKKLKEYAFKHYGIRFNEWRKKYITDCFIGKPIRRSGKKNSNGSRIRSRVDQTRYAEMVRDVARGLRDMRLSLHDVKNNPELREFYETHIKPKLSRR